jgi:hypothetical protein
VQPDQTPALLNRRQALLGLGALGGACLLPRLPSVALSDHRSAAPSGAVTGATSVRGAEHGLTRWEDPASWRDRKVPGPRDIAVVDRPVLLAGSADVAGVLVEEGGALLFAPTADVHLRSRGNVVVRGRLTMRPATPLTQHRLSFWGIDERRFRGGHTHRPLASDVGLWITDRGVLEATGAPKTAWTRALTPLSAGISELLVHDAKGWLPGDRIAITPTGAPTLDDGSFHQDVDHALCYDEAVIVAVNGNLVCLQEPLQHEHPLVTINDWTGRPVVYGAEVLNLTRNAVIEGSPEGRAHVQFLHTITPQQLAHLEIRHIGPRQERGGKSAAVTGRYGLHFHMCHDGSRGSLVEGVVIHSGGAQGFVPHDSHGITLRDCVAHDVMGGGFWWDLPSRRADYKPASHDSLWERCVASKITAQPNSPEAYRLAGFSLSDGRDGSNRCIDSVAVGVTTDRSTMNSAMTSGFHWTERGRAVWQFSGCVAHNNGGSGILSWQNDEQEHLIETFTAYHNGRAGIDHGAYSNFWHYRDCALHGNRYAGVAMHAVTRRTNSTPPDAPLQTFERIVVDGAGISSFGFTGEGHRVPAQEGAPVLLTTCRVTGTRGAALRLPGMNKREEYRVADCHLDGPEFHLDRHIARTTFVRVDRLNGAPDSFVLRRRDRPGKAEPRWNASRA